MSWHWLNFNLDGSVLAQDKLKASFDEHVDLRHCQDIARLYANRKAQCILRQTIQDLRKTRPGPWVSFMGSGDYHHLSAILLETLPADLQPVSLVLVDNHPDWFDMPLRYHCGTWVATAMRLPYIESAILIGMTSDDLKGHEFWFSPFADLCSGRITLHPYYLEDVHVPLRWPDKVAGVAEASSDALGTRLHFETVAKLTMQGMCQRLASRLAGKNVILSIDKDCLSPEFATTDWEQGKLTTADLVLIIKTLSTSTNLVGIDVCGEHAPQPLKGPWKRYDAGRLSETNKVDWARANELNQITNVELVAALMEGLKTSRTAGNGIRESL